MSFRAAIRYQCSETIYSELYPFVEEEYIELPEDGEIIEEPIVDEVLEEVENEVVM